jgi:ribosomal-protein-alanine N-acetyltransferase
MAEAVAVAVRFGFLRLRLHRIEANVTAGNAASAGLLKRLGFTLEGTWRDKVYARGQFHDLWQFGLLENEYDEGMC